MIVIGIFTKITNYRSVYRKGEYYEYKICCKEL